MIRKFAALMVMVALVLCVPGIGMCSSVEPGWKAVGIRGGFSVVKKWEDFEQYEVLAIYRLPWEWRMASGWGVAPQVSLTAGILQGDGKAGFIGGLAPSMVFNKGDRGLELEIGVSLNGLQRQVYGRQDLGSNALFGAFFGIGYQFENGIGIGYNIQHYSNGHIFYHTSTPNPGIDNHLFLIKWQL